MKHVTILMSAIALALGLTAGFASAGEQVSFQGPPIQPTPFKIKRALAKGITLEPSPGIEMEGQLSRPSGDGPFPAVVVLTGATGLNAGNLAWADWLADQGYVALVVDSFKSRGGTSFLDTPAIDMTTDAFIGHFYLSSLDYVDADKIGLLGFSLGGGFVQTSLTVDMKRRPAEVDFKAGISFYPTCEDERHMIAPVLILAGDNDELMNLGRCKAFVNSTKGDENPVDIHVYPGATHFFDNTEYAKDTSLHSQFWIKPLWYTQNNYDADAAADARARVLAFLQKLL